MYKEIANSSNYTRALQTDIDHLKNWATLWQLRFNPEKCETMRIIHNLDKSSPSYTMGVAIKPVKCVKDLGLLISYDLSWGAQVDFAVNKDKANKILGIVYRTIGPTNQEAFQYFVHNFSATYPPICRPSVVPIPSKRRISSVEKIQRRASRLALGP